MDASDGVRRLDSELKVPTSMPTYKTPWMSIALAVSGVACVLFSLVVVSATHPLLMSASLILGCSGIIKSFEIYKLTIGQAQFEYAMGLPTEGLKKVWLEKAMTNNYVPAANEFAKIYSNQLKKLRELESSPKRDLEWSSKRDMEIAKDFVLIVNETFSKSELKSEELISLINKSLKKFEFSPQILENVQRCIEQRIKFTYQEDIFGFPWMTREFNDNQVKIII